MTFLCHTQIPIDLFATARISLLAVPIQLRMCERAPVKCRTDKCTASKRHKRRILWSKNTLAKW